MINKTRIMLYVEDVEKIAHFWVDTIDAIELERQDLPENFLSITLKINDQVEFSLFPKEFIKKYSPEVLGNTPSIMLFSSNFNELHQKIENAMDIMIQGSLQTFAFPDPEGNYFVIAEA